LWCCILFRHWWTVGPIWINSQLRLIEKYNFSTKQWALHVQSCTMVTDVTAHVYPDSSGYHYCHLLSPARALEWIYVDGLRRKDGINERKEVYENPAITAIV
jgi:predicted glycosyl hydrolase (DUF1957 family)